MMWYEGTDIEIKVGEKVQWHDDEAIGLLVELTDSHFSVRWQDSGVIQYPLDHIAGIRPT